MPFGALFAFSVLLMLIEVLVGAARAELGFVFALATVLLTVGTNVAPRLFYRRLSLVTFACDFTKVLGRGPAAAATGFTVFALA